MCCHYTMVQRTRIPRSEALLYSKSPAAPKTRRRIENLQKGHPMINVLGTVQALIAIVPAIILCVMIYRMDKVEKEPVGLIILTFILGGVAAAPILVCEIAVDAALGWLKYQGPLGMLLFMLLGVALIEEFFKLMATMPAYKSRHFNYTFDGVVYCASAALGYACLENILYIVGDPSWMNTAVVRGVLAVPGHMCDGIFMGVFLGMAKYYSVRGMKAKSWGFVGLCLAAPITEHMIYDTLCQFGTLYVLLWSVFVYVMAFIAVGMTKGKHDKPIFFDPRVSPYSNQYWRRAPYFDNPRHPYQQDIAAQYQQPRR